jgi:glutaredoxin
MTMMFRLLILVLLAGLGNSATAEIYKWVDDRGTIHFSSSPPEKGKVEKIDVQVNSIPGYSPKKDSAKSQFKFDPGLISKRKFPSKDVIMYSASWCGYCKQARRYFKKNKIAFDEYDIEKSSKGKADYRKLGGNGVPLILVGKQRMSGFSEAGFKKIYQR